MLYLVCCLWSVSSYRTVSNPISVRYTATTTRRKELGSQPTKQLYIDRREGIGIAESRERGSRATRAYAWKELLLILIVVLLVSSGVVFVHPWWYYSNRTHSRTENGARNNTQTNPLRILLARLISCVAPDIINNSRSQQQTAAVRRAFDLELRVVAVGTESYEAEKKADNGRREWDGEQVAAKRRRASSAIIYGERDNAWRWGGA